MISLVGSSDKFVTYRYEVGTFSFNTKGSSKLKMEKLELKSLTIINDYIGNVFPIIQIKVSMTSQEYYNILSSKKETSVYLSIYKYYTLPSEPNKSLKEKWFSGTFALILDDDNDDFYASVRDKNNVEGQDSSDLKEQDNIVEFFLFKKTLIKASKKRVNFIIKEQKVISAIALIHTKMGIHNLLMTKPNNEKFYKQLIVPPLKAIDAIKFIDTFYGIYKSGMLLFYDYDRSYLLKYGYGNAYEPNEKMQTVIIVPVAGSEASQNIGALIKKDDNSRYYIVSDFNGFTARTEQSSGEIINGSDVHVIDSNTGAEKYSTKKQDKHKVFITNYGLNRYLKDTYLRQYESMEKVIEVDLVDFDLDALKPNKLFNFRFEDAIMEKRYCGNYMLVNMQITLFRRTEDLTCTAHCVFRKMS